MKSQGLRVSHGQGEGLTAHSPCHPSASPVLRTRACRRLRVSLAQLAPGVEATLFPELWGGSRLGPCWAGRPWFPGNPDPAPGTSDHGCSSSIAPTHALFPHRPGGWRVVSPPPGPGHAAELHTEVPVCVRPSRRGIPSGGSSLIFCGCRTAFPGSRVCLQPPPSETRGLLTCLLERFACPSSSLHLDNIRSHL